MDWNNPREWLSLVADLLGSVGFVLTLVTLVTARKLRAEIHMKRRLPQILSDMSQAHRRFRSAKGQGSRQACVPEALEFQRLLGELARMGKPVEVPPTRVLALNDLVVRRNFDQLESVDELMQDAVKQMEDKVKALHD
ncbi:MAG: hypothetical protein JNJ54_18505 [Myxococcaceae bacterium]|nr:hypothetical protein [Myxococcaceae bacterium]